MIEGLKVLAIIPARGGSKGIPRKNIRSVGGIPLIKHTIKAALNSKYIDVLHVSTDDEEIRTVAEDCGVKVPFLRDSFYAQDDIPNIPDVVCHTVQQFAESEQYDPDIVLLLEPTYPFRNEGTIDGLLEQLVDSESDWVVTISKTKEHPLRMREVDGETGQISPFLKSSDSFVQRQEFNQLYNIKGSVYGSRVANISKQIVECTWSGFPIQPIESIDIDDFFDLRIARALMGDTDED